MRSDTTNMGEQTNERPRRFTVRGTVTDEAPAAPEDARSVRALVEYGASGERGLYDLPAGWWDHAAPPEVDQRFRLTWAGDEEPILTVLPGDRGQRLEVRSTPSAEDLQDLLGVKPGDRVLVVLGPNPQLQSPAHNRYWFINAGWGEALSLTRLPYLLLSAGIAPSAIEYIVCEPLTHDFSAEQYSQHHIVFLGSTMSNTILREWYWDRLELRHRYEFLNEPNDLRVTTRDGQTQTFTYADNIPSEGVLAPADVEVRDPFFLARTPNPDDETGQRKCILSCGSGTSGTGYGIVALSARRSATQLLDWFGGGDFETVCRVDMNGFFNPESDPVDCLFGCENAPQRMLDTALLSPTVWSERTGVYDRHDFEADFEVYRRVREQSRS